MIGCLFKAFLVICVIAVALAFSTYVVIGLMIWLAWRVLAGPKPQRRT